MRLLLNKVLVLTLTGATAGCATVAKNSNFDSVQKDITLRTGYLLQWRGITADDAAVDASVHSILAQPLSVDQAVQVALLNNRTLEATYEELGIAQADLVQAGLLKNPVFSIDIRLPDRSPKRTYINLSVEEDFIDLLLLPARKKLAAATFEQAKARVTDAVIHLAADARVAYFDYQKSVQMLQLQQGIVEAQSASFDAAKRLYAAGNMNEMTMLQETYSYDQARMALSLLEIGATDAREKLTDLMGLWGNDTQWKAQPELPQIPVTEIDPHGLENLAVRQRSDLVAARQDVLVQAQALGFAKDLRFLSSLEVGPDAERETDGQWRIGPAISFPIPIFDQGKATVAKAISIFRQSQQRYYALAVSIRSQVRSARARMDNARERIDFYHRELAPLQQKLMQQNQLQYNGMLLGVFQLLKAKQNQIQSQSDQITALHDYWLAHTQLERAIGGRLPTTGPTTQKISN